MSIPVIGTAVVNSAYWVTRLLMSVDFPVDTFVIIDNNGKGELDEQLDLLKKIKHKFIKNIVVSHMPSNVGVSGAWNLIIKCYMNCPYWVIVNDDVAFGPGLLKEMYEAAEADPEVGLIHAHEGEFDVGSWDLFLIRDSIIQLFGLFDENLYPAYCEDSDYFLRFVHQPIKKIMSLKAGYLHGNGDETQYSSEGRQTTRTNPELYEKLNDVTRKNIEYLDKKWGPDWRYCSPSILPFGDKPISQTTYDLGFVRQKNLGF